MSFVIERVRRRPGAPVPALVPKPAPVRRPMDRREIADAIASLKDNIRRMRPPMNSKPDAFHEDKSDLVQQAIALEEAIRHDRQLTA
jgi:hypothetical protein